MDGSGSDGREEASDAPDAWDAALATGDAGTPVPDLATARARAAALVATLSNAEKLLLVNGVGGACVGNLPAIPSVSLAAVCLEDGPAGVGDGTRIVTAFPMPITLAATWDVAVAKAYGAALASEARAKGVEVLLAPMMNLDRVPVGGRNPEGYGEDPYLAASFAASEIAGIQSLGIVATAKHYADNDQETDRKTVSVSVDDRAQHEVYLQPFEASVQAGVGAVMCSYNRVGGVYACESDPLLDGILKGEWAFPGWVMSDWGATHSTVAAANAGLDQDMPGDGFFGAALADAVEAGTVSGARLDDMATRILTPLARAGILDRPPDAVQEDVSTPLHWAFASDVAAAGTVLLKNSGALLPIDPGRVKSIALIGAAARDSPVIHAGGSSSVEPSRVVTPFDGIAARAAVASLSVTYASGASSSRAAALALAAQSDLAIVVSGVTSSEGGDRSDLRLPAGDDDLISAVAAANPRTVVVVYAPAQVDMPWEPQVPALVLGLLPGQEEGTAIARILFGDDDPSGKLPFTLAKQEADYPVQAPASFPGVNGQVDYAEGLFVGYRWFDGQGIEPLFPFGYGLSYTTFAYSNLLVDASTLGPSDTVDVAVQVTNTGPRDGAEVSELYVGFPQATGEPPQVLRGFAKTFLPAGSTRIATFRLTARDFSVWDPAAGQWTLTPGSYALRIGSSSRDIRLVQTVTAHD